MSQQSHPQTWSLSQLANKASGECSVCHAVRQLHNKDGTVHQHGPRRNRCPGSGKLPAVSSRRSEAATYVSTDAFPSNIINKAEIASIDLPNLTVSPSPKLDHPHLPGNIIKHLPRSARPHCAAQLTSAIQSVIADPEDQRAWSRLLHFGHTMLLVPARAGSRRNLSNILMKRSVDDSLSSSSVNTKPRYRPSHFDDSRMLASTIRSKMEDGNIKAAVRIICSEEKPAAYDQATFDALCSRHPPEPIDRCALPNPSSYPALQTTEGEVIKAIRSFPAGSSAGPDGLRPQHLLDLVNCQEAGRALIAAITALINLLLEGRCPPDVTALLFGGKLFALSKKSGGVRPIAIGYTFRRLAAKCANSCAISLIRDKLLPLQLGVGIPGGCEAAVHATRRFMAKMSSDDVVVKLDFSNAFNCLRRDVMLKSVADELPCLYRFCHLAYGSRSALLFGEQTLWSMEGVQQGDPLGPLLFCLTIQPLLRCLSSELIVAYMDDFTLGGQQSLVADDVSKISALGVKYGLRLNFAKCEAISLCGVTSHATLDCFQQFTPLTATLLGAPLSAGQALTDSLAARCADLARAIDRLTFVSAHDALLLLKNSLSAPKLLHILRSTYCEGHELLTKFDDTLKSALCLICNISLTEQQWLQASLPVRAGGLGIRRVSSLAPSAFLASAAGTRDLQDLILCRTDKALDDAFDRCLASQLMKFPMAQPSVSVAGKQREWDKAVVEAEYSNLFNCYNDPIHKARLRAAAAPHSGDWLHALPIAACGLHLDNDSVRVAVGLRLGCALCQIHTCPCGATVDTLGSHAWSCKHNAGRIQRHAFINDLIYRALVRAAVPAVKEPLGLTRVDGKRPDGLTLVPWQTGRSATWDVTVVHTLAASYVAQSAVNAASAAEVAASRKASKYSTLSDMYHFYPVAIETLGPLSDISQHFISDIGRRISQRTLDQRETAFLFQRISVAIQRFNSVCLANSFVLSVV